MKEKKNSAIAHAKELIRKFKKWLEDAGNPHKNQVAVAAEGTGLLKQFKQHLQGEAIDSTLLDQDEANLYTTLVDWAAGQTGKMEKKTWKEGQPTLNIGQAILAKALIDATETAINKKESSL